jgi:osmotically inducible protein OsmC
MADLERRAQATWKGDLKSGKGEVSGTSGVLKGASYTFATRFENAPGTNPEELIAAAHAACFSMAFSNELSKQGHVPVSVETKATVYLSMDGGPKIYKVRLETAGKVPGIDNAKFQEIARGAKDGCPVSKLLAPGLQTIELDAKLL